MLSCSLVQLAIHFNNISSWFSVGVLAVENPALFPDVLSGIPYVHWLRAVKNTFVAAGPLIVKFGLLGLFLEVGFLMNVVGGVP